MKNKVISFIGSAGIPNRYGGFESFLEHCTPAIIKHGIRVLVTCDRRIYEDRNPSFNGVKRIFLRIPANGGWSIMHDLLAFFVTFPSSTHIIVLGVSGGIWFPLFRLLCAASGKRLLVNIDGVEWRRSKFGKAKRMLLRTFDYLAQRFAHHVIYDSEVLQGYLIPCAKEKASCIAYPGDHVIRTENSKRRANTALTICRIEPENNLALLIEGALKSNISMYTIVGNWNHSHYSRELRNQYKSQTKLNLIDPIYNPKALAQLRESCEFYLHGHSVGGTNPSLVEMLFYDCTLLCFDIDFNRHTAEDCARYFNNPESLAKLLNSQVELNPNKRSAIRNRYTAELIASKYIKAAQSA